MQGERFLLYVIQIKNTLCYSQLHRVTTSEGDNNIKCVTISVTNSLLPKTKNT